MVHELLVNSESDRGGVLVEGAHETVCALHYREWEEAMLKISFIHGGNPPADEWGVSNFAAASCLRSIC